MNPVLHQGVQSIRWAWVLGMVTIAFIAAFAFWVVWVFARRNKKRFEDAAKLPFENENDEER